MLRDEFWRFPPCIAPLSASFVDASSVFSAAAGFRVDPQLMGRSFDMSSFSARPASAISSSMFPGLNDRAKRLDIRSLKRGISIAMRISS